MCEWRYSYTCSQPLLYRELCVISFTSRRPHSRSGCGGEEKNATSLPGMEHRSSNRGSSVTILTELPRLHEDVFLASLNTTQLRRIGGSGSVAPCILNLGTR
jgi:hypothetical protein